MKMRTSNTEHRTPNIEWRTALRNHSMFVVRCSMFVVFLCLFLRSASAETLLLTNAVVHTVSGETYTNGGVLIQGDKIAKVFGDGAAENASADRILDLQGQHLYPGMIAMDSALGLTEISAVRSTQDTTEVGDFTPDVQSWIAVNPDSELLPVTRANGIAYFEPVPQGNIISGQSGLVAMDGWTYEQMTIKKPVALHVFWPSMELDTAPREKSRDPSKWKSLEDQAKERRARLRSLADFFEEARAYAKAKRAAAAGHASAPEKIPAWEAMLPYLPGEVIAGEPVSTPLPIVIHADEVRQIRSAIEWAGTNGSRIILAGGRDAWMVAGLLATNKIPVIYENTFTQPARDTESYDVHFKAPEVLRRAGVTVAFSAGSDSFSAGMTRNLPYAAAQAVAFGLPEDEALKGVTLYPAQLLGVGDRLGSIEAGKEATLFVSDGDILDLRANVKQMWIAGKEVNLENRHTRLYEKYRNRPKPGN
jgi:imidazolonepropionase-like amidohydrolase